MSSFCWKELFLFVGAEKSGATGHLPILPRSLREIFLHSIFGIPKKMCNFPSLKGKNTNQQN